MSLFKFSYHIMLLFMEWIVVSQAVKEVLQSLVDDALVDFDKIGSGNFYWALPSKGLKIVCSDVYLLRFISSSTLQRQNKVQELETKLEQIRNRATESQARFSDLLATRNEGVRLAYVNLMFFRFNSSQM